MWIWDFLIQVSLVFAALSTLLQLYAKKIKLGSGLPVIIGVSFAYVPTMTAIAAQAKDVNTIFGAMVIGGVVAILVGLFIRTNPPGVPAACDRNSYSGDRAVALQYCSQLYGGKFFEYV